MWLPNLLPYRCVGTLSRAKGFELEPVAGLAGCALGRPRWAVVFLPVMLG